MSIFLGIVGALKIIAAVLFWFSAGTIMHEIAAILLLGFGFILIGIATIIDDLNKRQP